MSPRRDRHGTDPDLYLVVEETKLEEDQRHKTVDIDFRHIITPDAREEFDEDKYDPES